MTSAALRPTLNVAAASRPSPTFPAPALPAAAGTRAFFSLPDITKLAGLVPGAPEKASDAEEQRFSARKIMP